MPTPPVSSNASGLPLDGITVADFSWVLAGPRATSWLGAMGARVIKIEGPKRPDQYRAVAIYVPGLTDMESSGAFHHLNHTKYGVSIDFNTKRGLELAKRIVAMSDIVVENFSYGVMERVGLGYEELKKIKPDVIMVQSSAVGKTGPDKSYIAYGTLIHAFSGINSVTGYDGEIGSLGGTYSDPLTGTTIVLAILSALWHRRRTGEGQQIDLSMVEATMMQLPEYVLDYTANGRVGGSHGNDIGIAAPHNTYACDGFNAWVAICVEDDDGWLRFCGALGNPEWTRDACFRDQPSRFENRRQHEPDLRPLARRRVHVDAAAMLRDDVQGNRHPQARAALALGREKRREDLVSDFRGDSRAGIDEIDTAGDVRRQDRDPEGPLSPHGLRPVDQ